MWLLGRLNLWQKLGVIVGALLIPMGLASAFYVRTVSSAIDVTHAEIAGARYLQPLGALHTEMLGHRGQLQAVIGGNAESAPALAKSREEIDRLMSALDAADAELNGRFDTTSQWRAIRDEWSRMQLKGSVVTAAQSDEDHERILKQIVSLNMKVWMDSTLSLDPQATAYYLIIAATDKIPNIMDHVGGIRMLVESRDAVTASTPDHSGVIRMHRRQVEQDLRTIQTELASVAAQSDMVREKILPALETVTAAYASFESMVREPASAGAITADARGVALSAALANLSGLTYTAVMQELNQRLSTQTTSLYTNVTALVALLAFALALCFAVSRSITRPMSHAVSVFASIAQGQYENRIQQSGTDEVGKVLIALAQMQDKLRQLKEDEANEAATVSGRIRAALEHSASALLVADSELKVIYLNQTFGALMRGAQSALERDLPHFRADALLGADVGMLYKDSASARATLGNLRDRHHEEVAIGGRTFRIDATPVFAESGDRIGTVLEWTDRTDQAAVESEMQEILQSILAGNLERRITVDGKRGFLGTLSAGVNQLVDNMAEMIALVQAASAEVYRGAREIASGNGHLYERTEQQSSSLQQTASSMGHMTSTVKQNADHANQANELAVAAREDAVKGGAVVTRAVHAMQGISDSSRRIADIIGVIDEIAFQTNLLALNAAVEAARAGEQGRGFAVVASEVRSLAGRSAVAAKEIKHLIEDSQHKVREGELLVTQSGTTLEQIVESVKKLSGIVADIAAASQDQTAGIEQVNGAVAQMDEITRQNASLVDQASAASKDLAEAARRLDQMMGRYRIGVAASGARDRQAA
jgi:methyl-accepting chemotaxis protein